MPETASGVYVVAFSGDAQAGEGVLPQAPLRHSALEHLLAVRPEMQLDGHRPDINTLEARLAAFWLPETVLYIGLATSLRSRVRSYYRTPFGRVRSGRGIY